MGSSDSGSPIRWHNTQLLINTGPGDQGPGAAARRSCGGLGCVLEQSNGLWYFKPIFSIIYHCNMDSSFHLNWKQSHKKSDSQTRLGVMDAIAGLHTSAGVQLYISWSWSCTSAGAVAVSWHQWAGRCTGQQLQRGTQLRNTSNRSPLSAQKCKCLFALHLPAHGSCILQIYHLSMSCWRWLALGRWEGSAGVSVRINDT